MQFAERERPRLGVCDGGTPVDKLTSVHSGATVTEPLPDPSSARPEPGPSPRGMRARLRGRLLYVVSAGIVAVCVVALLVTMAVRAGGAQAADEPPATPAAAPETELAASLDLEALADPRSRTMTFTNPAGQAYRIDLLLADAIRADDRTRLQAAWEAVGGTDALPCTDALSDSAAVAFGALSISYEGDPASRPDVGWLVSRPVPAHTYGDSRPQSTLGLGYTTGAQCQLLSTEPASLRPDMSGASWGPLPFLVVYPDVHGDRYYPQGNPRKMVSLNFLTHGDFGTVIGPQLVAGIAVPGPQPVDESLLPASCDEVFSDAYAAGLVRDGAVLNPDPSVAAPLHAVAGTADAALRAALNPLPRLECRWLSASGAADWGVETSIAVLSGDEARTVTRLLADSGFRPLNELGGTRYVVERTASAGHKYGESHIVLDNYWFATFWSSFGPSGYTADIVAEVRR